MKARDRRPKRRHGVPFQEAAIMATKARVERAILEREGFRVEFELLAGERETLPPYEYVVMAPQRWKVSDWKNVRLEPYRLLVRTATVYRGDGTPIDRDLQLGNLRDTYYVDAYGPGMQPLVSGGNAGNITRLSEKRERKRSRSSR
jgi:hypothetical protein